MAVEWQSLLELNALRRSEAAACEAAGISRNED
jgi:hypothetical protein